MNPLIRRVGYLSNKEICNDFNSMEGCPHDSYFRLHVCSGCKASTPSAVRCKPTYYLAPSPLSNNAQKHPPPIPSQGLGQANLSRLGGATTPGNVDIYWTRNLPTTLIEFALITLLMVSYRRAHTGRHPTFSHNTLYQFRHMQHPMSRLPMALMAVSHQYSIPLFNL